MRVVMSQQLVIMIHRKILEDDYKILKRTIHWFFLIFYNILYIL